MTRKYPFNWWITDHIHSCFLNLVSNSNSKFQSQPSFKPNKFHISSKSKGDIRAKDSKSRCGNATGHSVDNDDNIIEERLILPDARWQLINAKRDRIYEPSFKITFVVRTGKTRLWEVIFLLFNSTFMFWAFKVVRPGNSHRHNV